MFPETRREGESTFCNKLPLGVPVNTGDVTFGLELIIKLALLLVGVTGVDTLMSSVSSQKMLKVTRRRRCRQ